MNVKIDDSFRNTAKTTAWPEVSVVQYPDPFLIHTQGSENESQKGSNALD